MPDWFLGMAEWAQVAIVMLAYLVVIGALGKLIAWLATRPSRRP